MAQKEFTGENPFAVEMAEFIQEYLRNSNILLTVAHQSIEQIDDQVRNALLSLGTYIFGPAPLPEARILADLLYSRDPMRVRYWHRVWGSQPLIGSGGHYANAHEVIDYRPEFMNLEDQLEEAANRIAELGLFRFLCRPALREGEVSQSVIPITIEHVDRDEWTGDYHFPNPQRIREVCSLLAAQSGIPVTPVLKEGESAFPVRSGDRAGHSLRQQPPPPPAPIVPADGNREDTAQAQPPHRHHRSRRIS